MSRKKVNFSKMKKNEPIFRWTSGRGATSSELDFVAVWHIKRRRAAKTWETLQSDGRREKTTVVMVKKNKKKTTEGNILQRRRKIERKESGSSKKS